jgi:hypothetical protein
LFPSTRIEKYLSEDAIAPESLVTGDLHMQTVIHQTTEATVLYQTISTSALKTYNWEVVKLQDWESFFQASLFYLPTYVKHQH